MPRKKISTEADAIDAIPELGENEQVVIENKKTIRREFSESKRDIEPENIIDVDPDDFDDDEDNEPERNAFSQTSLAALIFDDNETDFADQYCTVLVRRKPDKMRDNFLSSCSTVLNYPAMANIEITADRMDIEEEVRQRYGGGHYYFQIRFNNRLAKSWESSLADLPEAVAAAKAEANANRIPTPTPTVTAAEPQQNSMDSFLDNLAKMKQLKDTLFGDEKAEMQRQIDELKAANARQPEPVRTEPLPENLQILEKALATQNPTLQEKLLDYAFPQEQGGHWVTETVKVFFEHKDEIVGLLGGLLGGLTPQPQPQPRGIADVLRNPAPTNLPPPIAPTPAVHPSRFQRRGLSQVRDLDGEDTVERSGDDENSELNEAEVTTDGN